MDQPKARLTGFVALVALALIFVPMLFDGQGVREAELQFRMPDAPKFPVMQAPSPQRRVLEDTSDPVPPQPEPAELRQKRMVVAAEALQETPAEDKPLPATPSGGLSKASPPAITLEKEVPVLDQQGVPVAWTLQLAAFKDRSNAEGLRDRLIKADYNAYIREKSALFRVYIGPEVQRIELERLKSKLSKELKLDGLILRFTTG